MKSLFLLLFTFNVFAFIQKSTFKDSLDITWDYQALIPSSDNFESTEYKIYTFLKNGELEEVLKVFSNSKMKRPFCESVYFNIGEALFRKKQYPRSIEFFRTFIAIYKNSKNVNLALLRIGQLSERLSLPRYLAVESYLQVIGNSSVVEEVQEAKLRLFGADYLRNINKPNASKNILDDVISEISKDKSNLLELKWILRIQSLYKDWPIERALEYVETLPINQIKNKEKFNTLVSEIYFEKMSNLFLKKEYRELLKLSRTYKSKKIYGIRNQKIEKLVMASRKIAVSDILGKNKG